MPVDRKIKCLSGDWRGLNVGEIFFLSYKAQKGKLMAERNAAS